MRSIQYALTSLYHVPFTSFASIEKETSSSYDIYPKIPRYILSFPNLSRFLLFLVW